MSEMKKFTVTLANGQKVSVQAKDKMEAARLAVTQSYTQEAAPPEMTAQRAAGLAGRTAIEGGIEGILGLPALAYDVAQNVPAAGEYLGRRIAGAQTKDQVFDFGMPASRALTNLSGSAADVFGLPQPVTNAERLMVAGGKGVVGALGGAGALRSASMVLPGMAGRATKALSAGPMAQAISGGASSAVVERAMQEGATPTQATIAGLVTGAGVPTALNVGSRTALAAARPFREAGRQNIVGSFLREQASDPERAMRSLIANEPVLPGSMQTTGPVSGDYGLMNIERGVSRTAEGAPRFAQLKAEQNRTRVGELLGIGGEETEASIKAARDARRDATDVAAYELFDAPQVRDITIPTTELDIKLKGLESSRQGNRTTVRQVIKFANDEIKSAVDENGNLNPGKLYSIRENLADIRDGRYESPQYPAARLAKNELRGIISTIDDMLEQSTAGYKGYMQGLRESGREIGQKEAARQIFEKAAGDVEPMFSQPILSLPRLKQGYKKMSDDLSTEQKVVLESVIKDIELGQSINNSMIRQAGADTFQNLSVGNLIGTIAGGKAVENATIASLARPFAWISKIPEAKVQELLTDAMLDPAVAGALMRKATPGNMEYASSILSRAVAQIQSGAGASVRQSQQERGAGRKPLVVNVFPPKANTGNQ